MVQNISALNAVIQTPIVKNEDTGELAFSTPFVRFLQNLVNDRRINTGKATTLKIASGVISVTAGFSYFKIAVESGSTDDLNTVSNLNEGDLIFFVAADATEDIVFKDGVGNIKTEGSVDLTLDHTDDIVIGHFDGTSLKCAIWNIA